MFTIFCQHFSNLIPYHYNWEKLTYAIYCSFWRSTFPLFINFLRNVDWRNVDWGNVDRTPSFSALSCKFESLEKVSASEKSNNDSQHVCPKDETIEVLLRDIVNKEAQNNHLVIELSEARECLKSSSETCVEYADRVKFLEKELYKAFELIMILLQIS